MYHSAPKHTEKNEPTKIRHVNAAGTRCRPKQTYVHEVGVRRYLSVTVDMQPQSGVGDWRVLQLYILYVVCSTIGLLVTATLLLQF